VRPVLVAGMALMTGGMVWYAQIPVDGKFLSDLLPGYLMVGFGMAFSFIPVSIAALGGVQAREAGLASGLINTAQQIGGALGVGIAATIAFSHMKTLIAAGHNPAAAEVSGFSLAFWVIAALAAAGVVAAFALVRGRALEQAEEAIVAAEV
jgi:MFS family permease